MVNFNEYPYRNLTDLNLDYLEKKMNVLKEIMDTFVSLNTVTFADPIIWNITTQYARNTVVLDTAGNAYLSKEPVPAGVQLNNSDYWLEIFNFTEYTRTANQNLTVNVETNTTRATHAYNVNDWLIWNDVLYKVTSAIAIDDALLIGTNIVHFTVEDFIKAFMTWATNTIQQYKNDIDASELLYRQQLAGDIANTTASLQAQLDAAIAGATVDSEIINARIGANNVSYATLGEAVRTQIQDIINTTSANGNCAFLWIDEKAIAYNSGVTQTSSNFKCTDFIPIIKNNIYDSALITMPIYETSGGTQSNYGLAFYDESKNYISGYRMKQPDDHINSYADVAVLIPINAKYFRTTWYRDSYTAYSPLTDFEIQIAPYPDVVYNYSECGFNRNIGVNDSEIINNVLYNYKTGEQYSTVSTGVYESLVDIGVNGCEYLKVTLPYVETFASNAGVVFMSNNGTEFVHGIPLVVSSDDFTNRNSYTAIIKVPDDAESVYIPWYYGNANWNCTKYYKDGGYSEVVLDDVELNDFYRLGVDGNIYSVNSYSITSFIPCHGVDSLDISHLRVPEPSNHVLMALCFYGADKSTIIKTVPQAISALNPRYDIKHISVPKNAYYFRTSGFTSANQDTLGHFYCRFYTNEYGYGKNRPYQNGYIFFSPKVNQSVNEYWNTNLDTELDDVEKATTSVLALPSTYTPTGKPTPIIMYFHGASHSVYYDTWGADDDFRTQKAQFTNAGFAVIDCNGARNNNKVPFTSGGAIQFCAAYNKTFEYVKEHYNVEDKCHVMAVSAGGIAGINYAFYYQDVKSLLLLSAWTDLYNSSYGLNDTASMIEYLGCDFTSGYDLEKTKGFDPALHILGSGNNEYLPNFKIPVKAMIGSTEYGTHIWIPLFRFINALRNAGQLASIRTVNGATHKDICSSDNLALNTEYINWCKYIG